VLLSLLTIDITLKFYHSIGNRQRTIAITIAKFEKYNCFPLYESIYKV